MLCQILTDGTLLFKIDFAYINEKHVMKSKNRIDKGKEIATSKRKKNQKGQGEKG